MLYVPRYNGTLSLTLDVYNTAVSNGALEQYNSDGYMTTAWVTNEYSDLEACFITNSLFVAMFNSGTTSSNYLSSLVFIPALDNTGVKYFRAFGRISNPTELVDLVSPRYHEYTHNGVTYGIWGVQQTSGGTISSLNNTGIYSTRYSSFDEILEADFHPYVISQMYPITYRLINCTAHSAPTEAAIGDTVTVPLQFTSGYGIVNPSSDVYVTNNGVVIPSTYSNGVLTFTMPDPT